MASLILPKEHRLLFPLDSVYEVSNFSHLTNEVKQYGNCTDSFYIVQYDGNFNLTVQINHFHRITEQFGLEGTFKNNLVPNLLQ